MFCRFLLLLRFELDDVGLLCILLSVIQIDFGHVVHCVVAVFAFILKLVDHFHALSVDLWLVFIMLLRIWNMWCLSLEELVLLKLSHWRSHKVVNPRQALTLFVKIKLFSAFHTELTPDFLSG